MTTAIRRRRLAAAALLAVLLVADTYWGAAGCSCDARPVTR